ncbi:hypothetical protein EXIGLDRAFT_837005 [Exidia glandulosa HHB12029]|uniref:Protein PBN1 n=1 Tax=Exidia glandulosa HHB12029 TaxID=1314781 RepID=A0A165H8Z7_EXIGL|nr:hypothetical protein EXIGLDRAFT_837005 [Exidia glandulosa HHB12029]
MHFTRTFDDLPSGLDCDLFALLELGPDVFVDPYELEHQHWLWGTNDLELPVAAVDPRGSLLLLNLTRRASSSLSIPLHARYPLPGLEKHVVRVPPPSFFWACDSPQAAQPCEPFKNASVPVEVPFRPSTYFYAAPAPDVMDLRVDVPTGIITDFATVDLLTKLFVLLLTVYIAVAAWRTSSTLSRVKHKSD